MQFQGKQTIGRENGLPGYADGRAGQWEKEDYHRIPRNFFKVTFISLCVCACVRMYMCMCVLMCMYVCVLRSYTYQSMYGGQRTIIKSCFSLSTMWVPENDFRLGGKHFYPWSPLTGPLRALWDDYVHFLNWFHVIEIWQNVPNYTLVKWNLLNLKYNLIKLSFGIWNIQIDTK